MATPPPHGTPLPPDHELALIDRELAQLDARRTYLLARRDWLLRLRLSVPVPAPNGWAAHAPVPPARPNETSGPGAQNVLLTLGAVLLAVAALAFTLVSWGSLGIAGRGAVLAVVTAAALGAPALLLRRGLRSTAESVAAVGLLLTVLDAYAVYAVATPGTDGTAYAAGAAAVLAALWAGYARVLPGPAIPLPAAVLTAQLPLPLAAVAAAAGPVGTGWALLATAALDAALVLLVPGVRARAAVSGPAAVSAAVLGAGALLSGLSQMAQAGSAGAAAGPALLLAACAALGVGVAWREPSAMAASAVGALAGVAALGGTVRPALAPDWAVAVFLLLALPLLAAVRATGLPAAVRRGLTRAGAGVAALAALSALLPAIGSLGFRVVVLGEVWAATTPSREAYGPGAAAAVTLLVAAGAAGWLARVLPRPEPGVLAVVLGWAGLFTAPLLCGLPVAAVIAAQLAVTAAAGVCALRLGRGPGYAAAVCAALGALNLSVAALDGRTATFAVFGLLGAGCAAGAARRPAALPVRAGAAVLAVGYAAGVAAALGALWGLAASWWALPLLAVPAAVAAAGPRLGRVRLPAEIAAGVAGAAALLLAAWPWEPARAALVCALAGVVCAGAAVRAERRGLGWAAGTLFVAATWIRLSASGVQVPEAYALPVTLPALAVGFVRRRRDARASSWTAYGPGLGATLLPSLLAAWGDPHWLRPLLLGLAALAVTLLGAHRRLQAPLLLGGATLAAVALHELAPYVVQVVDALPRWLPPALAGLLLLVAGATYEKRLRDARRLRAALGRLR
ncbi:SCO7613 C-terminal domain-containing membrane protein [Streptomyces sp. NPDC059355]|uniref:SCO7613 C-terminal domain-containing membrane protein n=1 Tax=Streptomyces sp. NPDC059355 TaxID=3346811 RepID=UPI0036AD868B